MERARSILLPTGLVVIAVFALLTALRSDESEYSASTFSALVEAVDSDFEANNARAEGAPQQQVVAGWAIKDSVQVAVLQAEETNRRLSDIREAAADNADRIEILIMLGVLAVCWVGIWLPIGRTPRVGVSDAMPGPEANVAASGADY